MLDRFQKWTPIAELAGALAVVVTLGFLVAEMRANTNAVQAQTYQVLMQEINDYRDLLMDTVRYEARSTLLTEGWDALTPNQQLLVRIPATMLWGIYESAYYANERGVLGGPEWDRFAVNICRTLETEAELWRPPGGVYTSMDELLTPDFVAHVGQLCGGLP